MTTTANTVESHLTADQLARAEALSEARTVLASRGPLHTGPVDAIDLVNVAGWILTGRDPWLHDAVETPEQSAAIVDANLRAMGSVGLKSERTA